MSEPMHNRGWRASHYQRPQDKWVCGELCEGKPCQLGPTSKGRCTRQTQCQPEKRGDRFFCMRPPIQGGSCQQGPLPDGTCCEVDLSCEPSLSLLAIRRRISWVAAVLALGYVLYLVGATKPSTLISPGPVIAGHASFEANCSTCHAAGEGALGQWLTNSVESDHSDSDSDRCLKCHSDLGSNALLPHGMSTNVLKRLTAETKQNVSQSSFSAFPTILSRSSESESHSLACAICHREHQGRLFDLKQLSDAQCQTCHADTFHSFENGHQEFVEYPYQRRTSIYFDHASHMHQHFPNPNNLSIQECSTCHDSELSGDRMLTATFEKGCANCHASQIVDSEFPGIPMFVLPRLDPQDSASSADDNSKAIQIGEWPHQEGALRVTHMPPFMRTILARHTNNSVVGAAGETLIDFRQTNVSDSAHQKSIVKLIWEIKELLFDYTQSNSSTQDKTAKSDTPAFEQLQPSIIPSLQQASALWFPNLKEEVMARRTGKVIPTPTKAGSTFVLNSDTDPRVSGWYLSTEDYSIRYRPIGHADPLLKNLLEQIVSRWNHSPATSGSEDSEIQRLYEWLASPSASGTELSGGPMASGRCLSCHAVDRNSVTGKYTIQWQSETRSPTKRDITQFSHKAHVVSSESETCLSCHQINATISDPQRFYRHEFLLRNSTSGRWTTNFNFKSTCTSGFLPIAREHCASCHKKSAGNQSCLQCHRYHAP